MTKPLDLDAVIAQTGAGRPPRAALAAHLVEKGRGIVEALRASAAARAVLRSDGWQNDVTGHGTTRDKTTYGYVLPDRRLSDPELSALYHYDDMAGRMVDVVPQEMLREGFGVETGEPGLNEVVKEKHRALNTRAHLQEGQRWGRCFGGGVTIVGCDDGLTADKPLRPELADDVDYLYTVDRRLVWPLTYYRTGPKIGQVEKYMITSAGYEAEASAIVHETRLIIHRGMPTAERERLYLSSWDLSVFQRAFNALRQFNTGWSSTEQLMADGSQAVYTIGGLQAIIASGGEDLLRERVRAMDMFRSVVRGIVLDADAKETFERKGASLEGWYQVLIQQQLRLAAAVEVPVTILMGQSPAGMNATGESDFRWFYDRIRSMQTNLLAPMIEHLTRLWLRTKRGAALVKASARKLGQDVVQLVATFPDLWRETPKDRAARELSIAQRDQINIQANVFSPDKVALTRGRPGGYDAEVVLGDKEIADLERRLEANLTIAEDENAILPGGEGADAKVPAAPIGDADAPAIAADTEEAKPDITLAPTDAAAVVTVNEARESMGLPPFTGPEGKMTLLDYKARNATKLADVAAAEAGTAPGEEPKPSPFGGGGFGGPPKSPARAGELDAPEEDPFAALEAEAEEEKLDAIVAAAKVKPRTFTLYREEDESGVSGTGEVAHGCLFEDGTVAMRWRTATASTTIFESMERVTAVHGHGGKTRIVWHDAERADAKKFTSNQMLFLKALEAGDHDLKTVHIPRGRNNVLNSLVEGGHVEVHKSTSLPRYTLKGQALPPKPIEIHYAARPGRRFGIVENHPDGAFVTGYATQEERDDRLARLAGRDGVHKADLDEHGKLSETDAKIAMEASAAMREQKEKDKAAAANTPAVAHEAAERSTGAMLAEAEKAYVENGRGEGSDKGADDSDGAAGEQDRDEKGRFS